MRPLEQVDDWALQFPAWWARNSEPRLLSSCNAGVEGSVLPVVLPGLPAGILEADVFKPRGGLCKCQLQVAVRN